MADRLVEIKREHLPILKSYYEQNGQGNYTTLMTIDNYIRWFKQDPNVKHIKVCCLNGDFFDGTFIITDRCIAYTDTLNESLNNLERLLQLIDYTKGYIFFSVRPQLRKTIRDALQKLNINVVCDDSTLLYYLPKEKALKFDAQSEDLELRPLTELRDIEKVNSLWPYCSPHSLPYFQRIAKYNLNVGAFKSDGTLVAWILRTPTGQLAALQTDEKYHRLGYGSLMIRYISKQIAEMGHDVYATIFEENTISRSLFDKHGFRPVGEVYWIITNITWSTADE